MFQTSPIKSRMRILLWPHTETNAFRFAFGQTAMAKHIWMLCCIYQLIWIRNLRLLEIQQKNHPFRDLFYKKRVKVQNSLGCLQYHDILEVELVKYRHMKVPTSNASNHLSTPGSGLNRKHTKNNSMKYQFPEFPLHYVAFIFST